MSKTRQKERHLLTPHELPKVWRSLGEEATAVGFRIRRTGGDHLAWLAPDGEIVHTALTPSDWRGVRNMRAKMEQHGLPKRGRGVR